MADPGPDRAFPSRDRGTDRRIFAPGGCRRRRHSGPCAYGCGGVATMAAEPASLLLQYLRAFDQKLDRVVDEMLDVKVRLTAVEEGLAGVNRRLDRIEIRIERIERRVGFVRP